MQEPEGDYQPAEPQQKRISLWLIGFLGSISVLIFLGIAVLLVVPLPTPASAPSEENGEDAAATGGLIPGEVEEVVYNIVEGDIAEAIEISSIQDDGNIYSIDIELLSEPESYDPVRRWTKLMCQQCSGIFKEHDIDRDISVWAKREENVYGRTHYSQDTDEFEFTKAEDLDQ